MRQLVSFHDMTDESEIEGVVAEIMQALGQEQEAPAEPVAKHTPGGVSHDQTEHGNWSDGSNETQPTNEPNRAPLGTQQRGTQGLPVGENSVMNVPVEIGREDAAFVREINDRYLAIAGPQLQHIDTNAGMAQMSVEGERRGIDTMGMYGLWEGNDFIGYSDERSQFQAEVLARMEAEQIAANGQAPGTGSKAVVMMGLPGAGKSFLIKDQLNAYIDTREYLTINADDIKKELIYGDTPPEIEGVTGMELSSMVHEESSAMRKAWEKSAMMKGTNVIFDITGANGPKTEKLLQKLTDLGYDIQLVHADVSVEEAQASAMRRAASGPNVEMGELDRVVPSGFIDAMRAQGSEGSDVIDQNFDNYLPYVSNAMWFRTYPLNVERDKKDHKPTELVWSSG